MNQLFVRKILFTSVLALFLSEICFISAFSQETKEEISETEASFSAFLFKGRSQRGSFDYSSLEPLQPGLIGLFDITTKYGNIYLGGDFNYVSIKKFACDPIVIQMTKG